MFILRDGRECLWQWDSDVQMIVSDPTVTEVHFCNKTDDCSLVCEVFEEGGFHLVNVPNILLQSDWTIRVYAYCTNHTKVEKKFKVVARSKPADYVYTETEVQTWSKLEERMDRVEATVTTEGIAKAVEDYLEENPIEAGATAEEVARIEANTKAINELKSANYLTESELEAKGYITSIPSEYITEEMLSTKGFLTQVPSEYVTETELGEYINGFEASNVFVLDIWNYGVDSESDAKQDVIDCIEYMATHKDTIVYMNHHISQGSYFLASVEALSDGTYSFTSTNPIAMEASRGDHSICHCLRVYKNNNNVWKAKKYTYSVQIASTDYVETAINNALSALVDGDEVSY